MSKLAIKGHKHRGKEVIQILEMLGGKNVSQHKGNSDKLYIIQDGEIHLSFTTFTYCFKVFTIEEFIEKFPYKVGDRVKKANDDDGYCATVICMDWDSGMGEVIYTIIFDDHIGSTLECLSVNLQPYKEQETKKVSAEFFDRYCKKCGSQRCTAEGEWLEGCEHYKEETMEELRIDFPEGYGYAGIENKQVIFTKIKPQYPKTYEECCEILDWNHRDYDRVGYNSELLCKLQVLLLCRDAYWKMAGEQMGLGKPWEPDWSDDCIKYIITVAENKIYTDVSYIFNYILSFPTEEIRDIFFENFKELIELCKVLL